MLDDSSSLACRYSFRHFSCSSILLAFLAFFFFPSSFFFFIPST
jgi:hypothetical protein